jgi:hypothetical protein
VKDALVEFFTHSKASSGILRFLSTKRKPVGYSAIRDEIRFSAGRGSHSDDLPKGAIHIALAITRAAGLVRLTRHGFSITDAGRDVQRRIPAASREGRVSEVNQALRAGISPPASSTSKNQEGTHFRARPLFKTPNQRVRS